MSELEELKLAYAECSRQRNELLNKLKSQAAIAQEPTKHAEELVKAFALGAQFNAARDGMVTAQEPWTAVTEANEISLPDVNIPVLVKLHDIPGIHAMVRLDSEDGWLWAEHNYGPLDDPTSYEADDNYDVTHWTALPAAPKETP